MKTVIENHRAWPRQPGKDQIFIMIAQRKRTETDQASALSGTLVGRVLFWVFITWVAANAGQVIWGLAVHCLSLAMGS